MTTFNRNHIKTCGLGIVFLWFMIGGIAHFTSSSYFVQIMPPYIPFHTPLVYISGVFEILGAIGVLVPHTRRQSGYGLLMLTVLVTPANVHMWLNPQLFPTIPEFLLLLRLPLQALLLLCIWWSTQKINSPLPNK